MLSHICSHMEDQNQLGLQATQKALESNPSNPALLFNLRIFQNRIGTKRDIQHVTLSSPCFTTPFSSLLLYHTYITTPILPRLSNKQPTNAYAPYISLYLVMASRWALSSPPWFR